jgi:hypothetical protein
VTAAPRRGARCSARHSFSDGVSRSTQLACRRWQNHAWLGRCIGLPVRWKPLNSNHMRRIKNMFRFYVRLRRPHTNYIVNMKTGRINFARFGGLQALAQSAFCQSDALTGKCLSFWRCGCIVAANASTVSGFKVCTRWRLPGE